MSACFPNPVCSLCDNFGEIKDNINWKQIAEDVFKNLGTSITKEAEKENEEKKNEKCQTPETLVTNRIISTGDDSEDEFPDEGQDEPYYLQNDVMDTEDNMDQDYISEISNNVNNRLSDYYTGLVIPIVHSVPQFDESTVSKQRLIGELRKATAINKYLVSQLEEKNKLLLDIKKKMTQFETRKTGNVCKATN